MSTSLQSPPAPRRFVLPQNIRDVLDRVAKKRFRVRIALFPLLIFFFLPLLWLVQALVDFVFTLPWSARLVLLLGDAALAGWLFYKHVVIPSRNRLNLRTSALLVERAFPQFRTSLISAVEFASSGSAKGERSAELMQLLINRAAKQVQQTEIVRTIISTRHLLRFLVAALAATLAVGGITWFFQPRSLVYARRVFLSRESLPTRTTVIPLTKEFTLNTGSDVELSARAEGVVPNSGRLVVTYPDGRDEVITVSPSPAQPAIFSVTLRNILQPFRYHFEINDGTGEEFQVATRTLPSLASTRFTLFYPSYTGRPAADLSAGSLSLLADAKLVIEADSTQPLKSATLELKGLNQTIRMDSGDNVANLRSRIQSSEPQLADMKAELEKIGPQDAAAKADMDAAQKRFDEARKIMEAAPSGDEKRKLGGKLEAIGDTLRAANGESDRVRAGFEKKKREMEEIQNGLNQQKKELENALAAQKSPDKAAAEKQKRILRAEISIPKEGLNGLSIHLVNEEGLASENDPVYRVNIILDKPPTVELSEPKSDRKTVLPSDTVRLRYSARDDFRIERLFLKYVILRPDIDGAATPSEQVSIPLTFPVNATSVASEYVWPLASFVPPLVEGSSISYWIEAADNFTLYSPGAGTTRKMSLIVVSPETKKAELIEEMGKAAKQIENLSNRQGKANEKTNSTLRK